MFQQNFTYQNRQRLGSALTDLSSCFEFLAVPQVHEALPAFTQHSLSPGCSCGLSSYFMSLHWQHLLRKAFLEYPTQINATRPLSPLPVLPS